MNEWLDDDAADDVAWKSLSGYAWPAAPEAAEFRAALLAHTTAIVRRRARWWRARRMSAICLAYAAGVLTMIVLWRPPAALVGREDALAIRGGDGGSHASSSAEPRSGAGSKRGHRGSAARPEHQTTSSSSPAAPEQMSLDATDEVALLSPAELRRLVPRASRQEQVRLLALAGDRYLFNQADVVSALDCYRQVIELTPAGEREPPRPEDSWLLAELKAAAQ